jgi:hypothetical protein
MLANYGQKMHKGRAIRRVTVVISDGFDSASIIDRRGDGQKGFDGGVTVFSITLPSYVLSATVSRERHHASRCDAHSLGTGGRDFAADEKDFTPVFKALAEEIRSSYAIAYYPIRGMAKPHEVKVQTTRPGIQLRASRTSYIALTRLSAETEGRRPMAGSRRMPCGENRAADCPVCGKLR